MPRSGDYQRLLAELRDRVQADAALAEEWGRQAARSPWAGADEHGALRFREWFLLEHAPPALGVPPAVAWAPAEPAADGPWQGLLEARFGVFRIEDETGAEVRDLWSGRALRLRAPLEGGTPGTLLLGRLAPAGGGEHLPLPGVLLLHAPAVAEALARDLARLRAREGGARLSAAELERLISRVMPEPAPRDAADCAAALAALVGTEPGWDPDRIQEIAAREGWNAVLEHLAFETEVDLDRARMLVAELRSGPGPAAAGPAAPGAGGTQEAGDDAIPPECRDRALRAYQASTGKRPLRERLARLERELGLERPDAPEPAVTPPQEGDALGPSDLPGMPFWIATYAWEREREAAPPSPEELQALAHFADFLQHTRGRPLDPPEVAPADLLGYLLQSPDPEELEARRGRTAAFFRWLAEQQQAPVGETLDRLGGATGALLQTAVATNAALAREQRARRDTRSLVTLDPPQVELEDGSRAPVTGLPGAAQRAARLGDRVLGIRDPAGGFRAGAWLPAELLP